MYPKNLVDNGDFNYQPGEFTGFQKTITQYCKPNGTVDAPSPWSSPGSADRRGGSAVDSMSGDGWMSGIQNPQEWKRLPKNRNIWVFPKIVGFPPKSSILIGFSIIFTIHFGVLLFLETPIWMCVEMLRFDIHIQKHYISMAHWHVSWDLSGSNHFGAVQLIYPRKCLILGLFSIIWKSLAPKSQNHSSERLLGKDIEDILIFLQILECWWILCMSWENPSF